jgi:hypothetical protein
MYNVTIVGASRTGKTSLVSQWRGHEFCTSYCATIFVEKTVFPTLIVAEIPSNPRFFKNFSTIYESTDVFILVVREDANQLCLYEELSQKYPEAGWLLVMNGPGPFPRSCLYARNHGIYMAHVNLETGKGVTDSLGVLWELTRLHPHRHGPVSLVGEVYQWLPGCL